MNECLNLFLIFLRLGLTSFGGPIAHLGYFHDEFVRRRNWFTDATYADIVALCQFLPGPSSSQVGLVIGASRAGVPGALAAWLGFTLPSALLLAAFGYGVAYLPEHFGGVPRGLHVVAVPIVAQALYSMARRLSNDRARFLITVAAALAVGLLPRSIGQLAIILAAGVFGAAVLGTPTDRPLARVPFRIGPRFGIACLLVFAALLIVLPGATQSFPSPLLTAIDGLFRAGAFVFGGGHVVLPLLETEFVARGMLSPNLFLSGYGAAQAVPGPLFTFAAFLGAALGLGVIGTALCVVAVFAPAALLVFGTLPFWDRLRTYAGARGALAGVNAAVVGLLARAFYDPICTRALSSRTDAVVAVGGFVALTYFKLPPWAVVFTTAAIYLASFPP